jgi:hypothetical protein
MMMSSRLFQGIFAVEIEPSLFFAKQDASTLTKPSWNQTIAVKRQPNEKAESLE